MNRYRYKHSAGPNNIVTAIQFTGKNDKECLEFCNVARDPKDIVPNLIVSIGGTDVLCNKDSWIIKDEKRYYVCSDEYFNAAYELCDIEDTKKIELRPCPFCGSNNAKLYWTNVTCHIQCNKCYVKTDNYINSSGVINHWNSSGSNVKVDDWHSVSLKGCVGWKEGMYEWTVVSTFDTSCICSTKTKYEADIIAEALNISYASFTRKRFHLNNRDF